MLSATWTNNISLVWEKSAMWMVLFVFYINMRSLDFGKLNLKFWRNIAYAILSINVCLIIYSFWLSTFTPEAGFQFSYAGISNSHSFFNPMNGNYMTSMIAIWIPINLFMILKRLGNQPINITLLVLLIFLLLIYNSRASAIALIFILLGTAFYQFRKTESLKGFIYIGAFILTFVSFVFLFISDSAQFFEQLSPLRTVLENTGDDRPQIWKWTVELFKESPLTGVGAGSWSNEIRKYGVNDYNGYRAYSHAHNIFLETLSELGIIGCLNLLLIFLAPIFVNPKREKRSPIHYFLCLSMIAFFIVNSFYGIIGQSLNLMCLAIVIIAWSMNKPPKRYFTNTLLIIPAIIVATAFIAWKEFADHKVLQHYHMLRTDKALAGQYIDQAFVPGINEFYLLRHLNFHKENTMIEADLEKSTQLLKAGLSKCPFDIAALYKLGQNYEQQNNYDGALQIYKKIIKLNERHFESYLAIAKIGNQRKYWKEFELGASIFEDYAIEHNLKYYNKKEIDNGHSDFLKRYWAKRLKYVRQYQKIKKERKRLKNKDRQKQN